MKSPTSRTPRPKSRRKPRSPLALGGGKSLCDQPITDEQELEKHLKAIKSRLARMKNAKATAKATTARAASASAVTRPDEGADEVRERIR